MPPIKVLLQQLSAAEGRPHMGACTNFAHAAQNRTVTAERSGRQLPRIQPRRTADLPLPLGQGRAEPPFLGGPAGGGERAGPARPPPGHSPRDRFDDQDAGAVFVRVDQPRQQRVAGRVRQLVDGVGRENRLSVSSAHRESIDIGLPGASGQAERAVRPVGFRNRPRMAIDAVDRAAAALERPCGPGGAGPAPEVENPRDASRLTRAVDRADDLAHDEKMQRRVEQGERRALASAVEGPAARELGAAFDVARRQRAERPRDFRGREVGQVTLFQRLQPARDPLVVVHPSGRLTARAVRVAPRPSPPQPTPPVFPSNHDQKTCHIKHHPRIR